MLDKSHYLVQFETSPPLVKTIKTAKQTYLYDTLTNKILRADDNVVAAFSGVKSARSGQRKNGSIDPETLSEIYDAYKDLGCFDPRSPKIVTFSDEEIAAVAEKIRLAGTDLLTLNITERCNMRCTYCAFSGAYYDHRLHSNKCMSLETAIKAVDWYLQHQRSEYAFAFYGGEPLLAFPNIKKVIEHVRASTDKPASFNLTTNCTLLSDEILDFFEAQGVSMTISLDGPREIHDRYRTLPKDKGTFDAIWSKVQRLYQERPGYYADKITFNMVLAPPYDFPAIYDFIRQHHEMFGNGKIQMAAVSDEPSEVMQELHAAKPDALEFADQIGFLIDAYQNDLIANGDSDSFLQGLFGQSLIIIHKRDGRKLEETSPSHGQCVPGQRRCFVDTDGLFYMCERVQNWHIGSVDTGIEVDRVGRFLREYSDYFGKRCQGCWAIRLCEKCFNDIRIGEQFSDQRFGGLCASSRRQVEENLTMYCALREVNDDAFAWADKIFLA